MSNGNIVVTGLVGSGINFAVLIFSSDLERNLRGLSLLVGITVGLVTLYKLMRKRQD